jgi:O-acetyl-ADP-ribose deacetylase (regulator of RNase III)
MRTIIGDLLDIKQGILVHQVNCQGVMGAGIALSIRSRWPIVYDEYRRFCNSMTPNTLLGRIQLVQVADGLMVYNLFGQLNYGRGLETNYKMVECALADLANQRSKMPVYFPYKIGCGLAGGDWDKYLAIIGKHVPDAFIVQL